MSSGERLNFWGGIGAEEFDRREPPPRQRPADRAIHVEDRAPHFENGGFCLAWLAARPRNEHLCVWLRGNHMDHAKEDNELRARLEVLREELEAGRIICFGPKRCR
jgi:hypothetical protein